VRRRGVSPGVDQRLEADAALPERMQRVQQIPRRRASRSRRVTISRSPTNQPIVSIAPANSRAESCQVGS
jgi:hypothetical protein